MSRIQKTFQRLAREKRAALIPYITAGYPDVEATVPLLNSMAGAGGDIIEVGMPFSDPMADGPVIQKACYSALLHGTRTSSVLDAVAQFRESDSLTPVVLMTYCNPVEAMGADQFAQAAAASGVDGVLMVDLPPDEDEELLRPLQARGLDTIFLLSPTTTVERARRICALASGFVYYVSLKGVTGARHLNVDEVDERIQELRACCGLPIVVGFGVHDADAAARLAGCADGIVVGSALVDLIARREEGSSRASTHGACRAVDAMLRDMRKALDSARKVA